MSSSLYNVIAITGHLQTQPTMQAMIQKQISKQIKLWFVGVDGSAVGDNRRQNAAKMAQYHHFWKFLARKHCFGNN